MPDKIHVVHIITRLDMAGSAYETLLTLLHLDPERYQLTLIKGPDHQSLLTSTEKASMEDLLRTLRERGVRTIELPSLFRRVAPWHDFRAVFSLCSLLRRLAPHGVHTHTSKAGFIGRLASRMARVPWIVHTPHGHVFWGHFGPLPSWVFLQMERFARPMTDHLIALTSGEWEDYIRLKVMEADRMSIIPSGVFVDQFAGNRHDREGKRNELGLSNEQLVVGFVGWLWPIKGVRYLMEAMIGILPDDPKVSLVFVGRGDEEQALKEQVATACLEDRVHFLGWRSDVPEVMACFDLLVLPSLNEGMGRVLVEAMATGLPIVATQVGGIPDLVKQGENGFLVPPADAERLQKAIRSLLQDPQRRKIMGEKGRSMCRPFNVENMVSKISAVYEQLQAQNTKS